VPLRHHSDSVADRIDELMIAVFLADEHERIPRLTEHLAADFVYVDPSGVNEGPQGLSDAYSRVRHDQWLHFSVRRTSEIDMHHAHFRYAWESLENGETVTRGWSFGWVDAEGKISRIVSFDDPVPNRDTKVGTAR
jgi:hypothetical protein